MILNTTIEMDHMTSEVDNMTSQTNDEVGLRNAFPDCKTESAYSGEAYRRLANTAIMMALLVIIPNFGVISISVVALVKSKMTVSGPRILIMSLAISDFMYGWLSIFNQFMRYLKGFCKSGGKSSCYVQAFFGTVFINFSMLLVLALSVERFCSLRYPYKYQAIVTGPLVAKIVGTILTYSMFWALLPFFGVNYYGLAGNGCDFQWTDTSVGGQFYIYYRALEGLVITVGLVVLNLAVVRELIAMNKRVAPAQSQGPQGGSEQGGLEQETVSLQTRILILMILTSITTIICNTPYLIRLLEYQLGHGQINSFMKDFMVKRLNISNSIVNPFLTLSLFTSLPNYVYRVYLFLARKVRSLKE